MNVHKEICILVIMTVLNSCIEAENIDMVKKMCTQGKTKTRVECPKDHIIGGMTVVYRKGQFSGCNISDSDPCRIGSDSNTAELCQQLSWIGENRCTVNIKVPRNSKCSTHQGDPFIHITWYCEASLHLDHPDAASINMCGPFGPWTGHVAFIRGNNKDIQVTNSSKCSCHISTAPENQIEIDVFDLFTEDTEFTNCPYKLLVTDSKDYLHEDCPTIESDLDDEFYVDTDDGNFTIDFVNDQQYTVNIFLKLKVSHLTDMRVVCGENLVIPTSPLPPVTPGEVSGDSLTDESWFWPVVAAIAFVLIIIIVSLVMMCCRWNARTRKHDDLEAYIYENKTYQRQTNEPDADNNGNAVNGERYTNIKKHGKKIHIEPRNLSTITEEGSIAGSEGGYEAPRIDPGYETILPAQDPYYEELPEQNNNETHTD